MIPFTVFTQSIRKFEVNKCLKYLIKNKAKIAGRVANIADPAQTAPPEQSDQALQCLQKQLSFGIQTIAVILKYLSLSDYSHYK